MKVSVLAKRSREERFNDVFQIFIIVNTLLLEFVWSSYGRIGGTVILLFAYIGTLGIWAFAHLRGGDIEFPAKITGFKLSLDSVCGLLLLLSSNTLRNIMIGNIIIIASNLIPSLLLLSYLRERAERRVTLILLTSETLAQIIASTIVLVSV